MITRLDFVFTTLGGLVVLTIVLFLIVLLNRAFKARTMKDLQKWHTLPNIKDNLTQGSYNTFSDYLAQEKEFLDKTYEEVAIEEEEPFNRYVRKSKSSPYKDGENLNSSFECFPLQDKKKGGILLIHGLTDSPYYLRAIAGIFAQKGYYVNCLRLPGHGTTPGALLDVKWEDWYAAVKFGAHMVRKEISKYEAPQFFVGGFSTGGALTLRYVLETLTSGLPTPDKLFLFSPAIGVSWLAEFADWHALISWIPYFRKFKWKEIKPEYEPCKYNSFPKNAADQIYELTRENRKLVKKLVSNKDDLQKMPPIYAFQSIVDATVSTEKLVEMMAEISTEKSELVLFDINRLFEKLLDVDAANKLLDEVKKRSNFKAKLIVVTNEKKSADVKFISYFGKEEIRFESILKWPGHFFALSHICIPVAPEDEYYGQGSELGELNVRVEKSIIALDSSDLIRTRYNPFFPFIRSRIENAIPGEL
ncbi:MAG: alpha/beta fold hydrolase [Candidatus Aminicenantes bacterium]|nr:alpha/beta fold hydrolase [Candidatus Aminicenantes bacterium]